MRSTKFETMPAPLRTAIATLRSVDWPTLAPACLLALMGLAALYSVELSETPALFGELRKQLFALGIGLAGFFFFSRMHIASVRMWTRPAYLFAVILLIAVLFIGKEVRGSRGWFAWGSYSLQPVEFVKIALVLFLARAAEVWGRRERAARYLVSTGCVSGVLFALVLLEPDLGSAMLLIALWGTMLLTVGLGWRRMVVLACAAAVVSGISWFALAEYQKDRVRAFLHPAADPRRSGYNVTQAVIAVGSGGAFGRGLGFGSQSQLRFLPERHTDFVFATIAEELGFVGALTLLGLFGALCARLLRGAMRAEDDFSRTLLIAVPLLFGIELCLNVGMNIGVLPVTGITLPLVSYGGSSLAAHYILLGIASSALRSIPAAAHASLRFSSIDATLAA